MKRIITLLAALLLTLSYSTDANAQVNNTRRQVVLQGFWWDYYNSNFNKGWANYLTELAPRLKAFGVDAVWIPPTIKNTHSGSVGYAPFDHYDLGDKFQKNSLETKLGDKDELLRMVAVLKANGIDVIQDIVLNHVTGAGSATSNGGIDPSAMDDGSTSKYKNFRYACFETPITSNSSSAYLSLQGRFPKNWQNFYPNPNNPCCTNEINSPYWGPDISYESDAFGLSSNATYNPAQSADYMRTEMRNWLIWYKKQMDWDGVRIDAVKHFPAYVCEDFLWNLQNNAVWASGGNDMFAVGEWIGGASELDAWAGAVQDRAGTFDFSLRNAFTSIIGSLGSFDLGTVPNYQQGNRYRTMPFVNNHDTYRPIVDASGNIIDWDTFNEIGGHIDPNDPRKSLCYAIALAVDGAPLIFFEDMFNIGTLGNRFDHDPTNSTELPQYSDIENLLWCHQNLRFKEGQYLVPWQAQDALVIERETRALIAVNDNWDTWQNLTGVQTTFPDGTVLVDYSGANGTAQATVYGGGKVDIAIPPCDGSALQGRRGYSVWAPQGITDNYDRPAQRTTQEWEMSNDLGDSQINSLKQGGALPDNSMDCRVVGKIYPAAGEVIDIELYPVDTTLAITVVIMDKDCNPLDSITQAGTINFSYTPTESNWHTVRINNATATQAGQKCWVKMSYQAPEVVSTDGPKNKCACTESTNNVEVLAGSQVNIYPNPFVDAFKVELDFVPTSQTTLKLIALDGRQVLTSEFQGGQSELEISTKGLQNGSYIVEIADGVNTIRKTIVKM
jgi:alpha-amylase